MLNKIPDTIGCFASVDGKVFRSLSNGDIKEVRPYYRSDGYGTVVLKTSLKRKPFYIHRCICSAFKIKDKPDVNHIDGNKANNHINNLEWVTKEENDLHATVNRLKASGIKNGMAKLDSNDVAYIHRSEKSSRLLGRELGVSKTTILNVRKGVQHRYFSGE